MRVALARVSVRICARVKMFILSRFHYGPVGSHMAAMKIALMENEIGGELRCFHASMHSLSVLC